MNFGTNLFGVGPMELLWIATISFVLFAPFHIDDVIEFVRRHV
jgi:hypothetical protein